MTLSRLPVLSFTLLLAGGLFFASPRAQGDAAGAPASANEAPSVDGIPGQNIDEKQNFTTIKLDDFVNDPNDKSNTLRWTASGQKDLRVEISATRVATIRTPTPLWNGQESISFTATDSKGAAGSQTVLFSVKSINDPPAIRPIPGQSIDEGRTFAPIKLDDFITDPDHPKDQITWSFEISPGGNNAVGELQAKMDANRVLTVSIPDTNWFGSGRITFTASDAEAASVTNSAEFVVRPINDSPIVNKISDQTIEEKNKFDNIDLNNFVSDVDDDITRLNWTVAGGDQLKAIVDNRSKTVEIKIPNDNWNGAAETFTFTARDPQGGSGTTSAKFHVRSVNDAPELKSIAGQAINEKQQFKPLALDNFVTDIDHGKEQLRWTFSGNKDLKVVLDAQRNASVQIPSPLWHGEETITFKVADTQGASAEENATFTVRSVNDIPVLKEISGQKIREGQQFRTIKLDDFVNDPDHEKKDLSWSIVPQAPAAPARGRTIAPIGPPGEFSIDISSDRIATVTIPDSNWHGTRTLEFTVSDPEGGKASIRAVFEVESVNDSPVLQKIADQSIEEKGVFDAIPLMDLVEDVDHDKKLLKWEFSGNKDLKISTDRNGTATIQTPNNLWNGQEKIKVTVTDPAGGKTEQVVTFTVKSINDVPDLKDIPGQNIREKEQFRVIKLDDFVQDLDHSKDKLRWTFSGNKDLKVALDAQRNATIQIPNALWHGEETITFTVTDVEGAKAERMATFAVSTVNDLPVLVAIAPQTIREGQVFQPIKLDDVVNDADHKDDQITWSFDIRPAPGAARNYQVGLRMEVDASRMARILVPDTNWHGSEQITFTATDPEGGKATTTVIYSVTSVNDAPILQKVADQSIDEKQLFATINLFDLVTDVDHEKKDLKWEFTGNRDIKVVMDRNGVATVQIPSPLWNGQERIQITVSDAEGGKAEQVVSFAVKSINDVPELKDIAEQTIREKEQFRPLALDALVNDPDHTKDKLKWTFSGNKDLKIVLDAQRNATIQIPNPLWHGEETITFTVTDPDGATAQRSAVFKVSSVNDIPVAKDIPGQKIREGQQFRTIKLDDFIDDRDHAKDKLSWSVTVAPPAAPAPARGRRAAPPAPTGPSGELSIQISADRIATIAIPDSNWFGKRTLTFTVSDQDGGKVTAQSTFEVESANDAPLLQKIADQTIEEKKSFATISLNEMVSDVDHDKKDLKWEFSGNKDLRVTIDRNGVATVQAPNPLWNGQEKIRFAVSDPLGAKTEQIVTFTISSTNDAPELREIASQTIKEKENIRSIALDALVNDPDHGKDKLRWTFSGNKDLRVVLDAQRNATIQLPNPLWHGEETIVFTATDPEGAKAERTATFKVNSVNDIPVLREIPGQKIREGAQFRTIKLDDFVNDADHGKEKLTWVATVSTTPVAAPAARGRRAAAPAPAVASAPGTLTVQISADRVATIAVPDSNWFGKRTISFTVNDPEGGKASINSEFEIESVNDAPVLQKIADQAIDEKKSFASIPLLDLVSDVDHDKNDLKWEFSGNKDIRVTLERGIANVQIPNPQWNGQERIKFTVIDPAGTRAEQVVSFSVKSINDMPEFKEIPSQSIKEKEQFRPLALDEFVNDPDHAKDKLRWTVSGGKDLKIAISPQRVASVQIPNPAWHGEETFTFTVTDAEGAKAERSVIFKVNSVNDLPVLREIPRQKVREGAKFQAIKLDDFVNDPDHNKQQLTWTASVSVPAAPAATRGAAAPAVVAPSGNLKVSISAFREAIVEIPDTNWHGTRTITWTATDPEGGKATGTSVFEVEFVNDAPAIRLIPGQIIREKEQFKPLDLSDLASDLDHPVASLKWEVSGSKQLRAAMSARNVLTVTTPGVGWNGEETLTLTVSDPAGGRTSQGVVFRVTPVNDSPVIKGLRGQTIKEKEQFQVIRLTDFVSDPDHKGNELRWTVSGGKDIKVEMHKDQPLARIVVPSPQWHGGPEKFTFTVTDLDGATASAEVEFTVTPVNDAPEVAKIPDQVIKEKDQFKAIELSKFVKDVDNKVEDLNWTIDDGQPPGKDARGRSTPARAPTVRRQLRIDIDDKGVATVSAPDRLWNGEESIRFTAWDPTRANASVTVKFTVTPVNDAPEGNPIPDQVTNQGTPFKPIKLDNHVSDPDHKNHEIRWTAAGNARLDVTITGGREAVVSAKRPDWHGSERITFTAIDPTGAKASFATLFTVNHVNKPPVMQNIPSQTVDEDVAFQPIALDRLARDPDHSNNELRWEFSGNRQLVVDHDKVRGRFTVRQPRENWNGPAETITFTVTDPAGAKDSKTATFTVRPVNDPAQILPKSYTTREGEALRVSRNDGLLFGATDVENDAMVAEVVNRPSNGNLQTSPDGSFTYTPKAGFYGLDEFTFRIRDRAGAVSKTERAEINVSFRMGEIRRANEPPPAATPAENKATKKAAPNTKRRP